MKFSFISFVLVAALSALPNQGEASTKVGDGRSAIKPKFLVP